MSILINTNIKREYMVIPIIPIIPIGVYVYIYTKTILLITLLAKNITRKIFTPTQIQIENKTMYHSINKQITTNQTNNQNKTIKNKNN